MATDIPDTDTGMDMVHGILGVLDMDPAVLVVLDTDLAVPVTGTDLAVPVTGRGERRDSAVSGKHSLNAIINRPDSSRAVYY
ncbi:hypothetical protein [Paenibacillus lautus]|uniref:hypothetical protein n=1 Tax=Paenibacillus lautus TaxID=1401 RepID=UPI002DBD3E41|nr:hypothetical protein [Paenibacillus lautus]MEC0259134.1 hypothetical protein [Paenibacillus lautus]